jgi:hypothetical protein
MRSIAIREVSAPVVSEAARSRELLGITNHNVLAGVLFPVTSSWLGDDLYPSVVKAFASPQHPDVPASMRCIGIRQVSAKVLQEAAERHEVLGLTSDNVLTGLLCPVTPAWIERLIEQNISSVLNSIKQGEKEIESEVPVSTLDDIVPE